MLDTIPFTSVHSNLECGLAILTESFSLLRSVLHSLSCWSPKQNWCDKPCYSWYCLLDMCEKPVRTSSLLIKLATATKVCLVENSISWWSKVNDDVRLLFVWAPGLEIPVILALMKFWLKSLSNISMAELMQRCSKTWPSYITLVYVTAP